MGRKEERREGGEGEVDKLTSMHISRQRPDRQMERDGGGENHEWCRKKTTHINFGVDKIG